jgi:hypothetical protein
MNTNVKVGCKRLSGTEECQLGRKSWNKVDNSCFWERLDNWVKVIGVYNFLCCSIGSLTDDATLKLLDSVDKANKEHSSLFYSVSVEEKNVITIFNVHIEWVFGQMMAC